MKKKNPKHSGLATGPRQKIKEDALSQVDGFIKYDRRVKVWESALNMNYCLFYMTSQVIKKFLHGPKPFEEDHEAQRVKLALICCRTARPGRSSRLKTHVVEPRAQMIDQDFDIKFLLYLQQFKNEFCDDFVPFMHQKTNIYLYELDGLHQESPY